MTDEQDLRDLIGDVLSAETEESPAGTLPPSWPTLGELGLTAVGVPESAGGSGGSLDDVAVLVGTVAEHGVSYPVLEATVAAWMLGGSGEPLGDFATIAVVDDELDGSGQTLSATLHGVPWARNASRLVVVPAAGSSWLVELGDAGVTVEPRSNVAGEPRDTVTLDKARVRALHGAPDRELVRARLGALWAAAIHGAARAAYETTRRHVMTREQFGAPLARIPAVASALATIRVHVLQAATALDRALDSWRHEEAPAARLMATAVARVGAGTAATEVARLAHQLHGAIGTTQEYSLHRFTRRLWAWRDAETPEHEWARLLGEATLAGGEAVLWDQLSA